MAQKIAKVFQGNIRKVEREWLHQFILEHILDQHIAVLTVGVNGGISHICPNTFDDIYATPTTISWLYIHRDAMLPHKGKSHAGNAGTNPRNSHTFDPPSDAKTPALFLPSPFFQHHQDYPIGE